MELNEIKRNYTQLGQNFENLGSNGLYLKYNGPNDWSVVTLNCFEKILRWLGFYGSTRLETIASKIAETPNAPQELINKISQCWQRTYPNKQCPLQPKQGSGPATTGPEENSPVNFIDQRPPIEQMDFAVKNNESNCGGYFEVRKIHQYLPRNIATDKLKVGETMVLIMGGDLLYPEVPCIVNAANERCLGGGGIDGVIHAAAGPELRNLCLALPIVEGENIRCKTGDAVITGSAELAQRTGPIQHIIHAVGPRSQQENREQILEATYRSILAKAEENGIRKLAIPSISTGVFQFPFGKATEIAIRTIETYLHEHPGKFDEVRLIFLDFDSIDSTVSIERAKNCAWAIHIARNMPHPYGVLEKAEDPLIFQSPNAQC